MLHRGLVATTDSTNRRLSVAVQLPPVDSETARAYLARYFNAMSVIVYWGEADEFAEALLERWLAYPKQDRAS